MPKLFSSWLGWLTGLQQLALKGSGGLRLIGSPPVLFGKGLIPAVGKICEAEYLDLARVCIITGRTTYDIAGRAVHAALEPKSEIKVVKRSFDTLTPEVVRSVAKAVGSPTLLIGIGGGSKADLTKLVATEKRIPYVLIPTALSHDGIASNFASMPSGSIRTKRADLILADLELLAAADSRFTKAGFGDVVTNYIGAHDWKLAAKKFGAAATNFSRKIAFISWLSAQICLEIALSPNIKTISDMLEELILGLVASATAMNCANSSIPCSGTEHTAEKLVAKRSPELHGTLCAALGLPLVALQPRSLQSGDWRLYRRALQKIGLPTTAAQLGLDTESVLEIYYSALFYRTPLHEHFDYTKHRWGILNQLYEKLAQKHHGKAATKGAFMAKVRKAMAQTGFAP